MNIKIDTHLTLHMSVKRKLTELEKRDICDQIPFNDGIPEEIAKSIRDGIVKTITCQLDSILIYPELIPVLVKTVRNEYYKSILQSGEMVGVQAATSIGEPVTQMSLNAFHFSGISTVGIASGVPRVEEIMNASKIQKSYGMTLYLAKQDNIRNIKRLIQHEVTEVYLSNIIDEVSVDYISCFSSLSEDDQLWYSLFFSLYRNEIMLESEEFLLKWRIRIKLNKSKLYNHSITCLFISDKIEESYRDLYVVPSPDNIGIIDIYVDFSQMKLKKKEEEELEGIIDAKEMICIRNIILPFLNDIFICGIKDIEDVYIHEEKGEWVIDTKGSNLSSIFQNENFDFKRCKSSDIWEIRKLLGIEAARQFIIDEFYKVLMVSGASIGRRHIELLADSMTFQGKISSVNRYGIDRNETGPLAKASFEESINNFCIAAVNGETDNMGVSSSIMAGRLAPIGTGYFSVLLDKENLLKTTPFKNEVKSLVNINSFIPESKVKLPVEYNSSGDVKTKPMLQTGVPPSYNSSLDTSYKPSLQMGAPPTYNPSVGTSYKPSLQLGAPPIYNPSVGTSYKPSLQLGAPPIYKPMLYTDAPPSLINPNLLNISSMVKSVNEYNVTPTLIPNKPDTFKKETNQTFNNGQSRNEPQEEKNTTKVSWVKRKSKVVVQFSDDD